MSCASLFADSDIANVAMNDGTAVLIVNIGHDLNFLVPTPIPFQGQIFIANLASLLQCAEHVPAGAFILEQTDLKQFLAHKLIARIAQQFRHEWVGVCNLAGHGIDEEHAVLRSFKEPAIADFRNAQFVVCGQLDSFVHLDPFGEKRLS